MAYRALHFLSVIWSSNTPTYHKRSATNPLEVFMDRHNQSNSVESPKWGPRFLPAHSVLYRLEMLLLTLAMIVILFYWRLFVVKDLNVYTTIFWLALPDLASFIPIGFAARGSRDWPRWGPVLYNFFHTFLVAGSLFGIWSLISGSVQ